MEGFSPRNIKYMRALAEAWPDEAIVQQAAAQIPWPQTSAPEWPNNGRLAGELAAGVGAVP